jgi:hypothetical protein
LPGLLLVLVLRKGIDAFDMRLSAAS